MISTIKLTFNSDQKIGQTTYKAGYTLSLPDVYFFGSVEQRKQAPFDLFGANLLEEIAIYYYMVTADISIEFDGGRLQQSDKFYADPRTPLTVSTITWILNPSLDFTVRISGLATDTPTGGGQPLSSTLTALSQVVPKKDTFPYFTGATTAALTTVTPSARTLLAQTSPANMVKFLGVEGAGAKVSSATFDTVADMMASTTLTEGTMAITKGYHTPTGNGGAEYIIWDLETYRTAIKNPTWVPDGESRTIRGKVHYAGGDHALQNGLVAILRWDVLWAGKIGLEDPVENEEQWVNDLVEHDFGLQKAVMYAKRALSTDKSSNGEEGYSVRRNITLHVEAGNYVMTKTCWVPANVYLCGGPVWGSGGRDVDFIPLKPHLGGNLTGYTRNYMFIWNGNSDLANLPPDIPPGSTPGETIYIAAYVGGWSGINLNNYETDYGKKPDGSIDWYAPNYLKGIKGAMVFGGGIFYCTSGNRMTIMYHRPGVDWLDYYTDGWQIFDYKANTPFENEEYQLDFNGSGDVIRIEQVQFPVNHPPKDKSEPWPDGEYVNGVVKGIRLHNWASWNIQPPGQGGSQEDVSYVGAGMNITRVINGSISIYGYDQVHIDACHLEFGQINLYSGSATVTNTYFSKITGARYNSVNCYTGPYGGYGGQLTLDSCQFHRGFDGAHQPVEEGYYDLVVNNNYTVTIRNTYQGWNTASTNNPVGLTVGYSMGNENEEIVPLLGWDRWSAYLSDDCKIIRGKLVPQERVVSWNGLEGVQDVYCTRVASPLCWDLETGIDLYYYCQYLADPGDDTVSPDFLPLGKNQRERFVTDAQGNLTDVRFEAHTFLKNPEEIQLGNNDPYTTWYRPIPVFYGENETPDTGTLRLYRGRSPFQYTEYVDLPMMSRTGADDYGTTCFGRKWKPNPMPIDTNPDLNLRKRNVLPLRGIENTNYRLHIRAGRPLAEPIDLGEDFYGRPEKLYFGTGGWELDKSVEIIRASNKAVNAAAEGVQDSITIYDRPFEDDVYVALGVTGSLSWDGVTKRVYKKGQRATIVRTKDTLADGETKADKALHLEVRDENEELTFTYNIGPGEIITAIYDEKDVLVDGKYVVKGEWIVVNHAPAEDIPAPYLYIEAEGDGYYNLMPKGVVETVSIWNKPNTEDVYSAVHTYDPPGCRLRITRGPAQTGPFFLLVQNEAYENVETIVINQTNSTITFIKKESGWEMEGYTTEQDVFYGDCGTEQYKNLTPPVGMKRAYFTFTQPLPWGDTGVHRLTHDDQGVPVPAGTFSKLYWAKSATLTGGGMVIRQNNDSGDVDLVTLTAPGQSAEFLYDGTNWHVVGGYN